jgi:hypothetical protein
MRYVARSGRRDSNPRHSAWKADALPTELLPQVPTPRPGVGSRTRPRGLHPAGLSFHAAPSHFSKSRWRVLDSNQRRRMPAGLQPAPFGHSGNPPSDRTCLQGRGGLLAAEGGASEGSRTPNRLFTKQVLCRLSYASVSIGCGLHFKGEHHGTIQKRSGHMHRSRKLAPPRPKSADPTSPNSLAFRVHRLPRSRQSPRRIESDSTDAKKAPHPLSPQEPEERGRGPK